MPLIMRGGIGPALAVGKVYDHACMADAWTQVHNLPGFAYFDHGIHVHKGMGCVTWCHGRAERRMVAPVL
jgi:hypothetical protein